jgi:heat shock protein HslJ
MRRILSTALLGLVIVGCAATGGLPDENTHSTDPQSALNKTWQWVSTITPVGKITVPNPERYTIMLTDDDKLQARFDCNRGGGEFKISPGKLSFGPLISTRMACPEDSLDGPLCGTCSGSLRFS